MSNDWKLICGLNQCDWNFSDGEGMMFSERMEDFALSRACREDNTFVVQTLISAQYHILGEQDSRGNTLLYYAIVNGSTDICIVLLDAADKYNVRVKRERLVDAALMDGTLSPLALAYYISYGDLYEMVKVLCGRGANVNSVSFKFDKWQYHHTSFFECIIRYDASRATLNQFAKFHFHVTIDPATISAEVTLEKMPVICCAYFYTMD